MSTYDEMVIGIGNPHHPANAKEVKPVKSLEDFMDDLPQELKAYTEELIAITLEARAIEQTYIANKLARLREKMERTLNEIGREK